MKLFQSGIKLVQRVLAKCCLSYCSYSLKKLGPDRVHMATTYSNLGQVHRELGNLGRVHHKQGHLKKARDYDNRARAIFLKTLGPDHVHMATIYRNLDQVHRELGNLGRVHHKQGHLKKARDYNNRARAIFLKKLGPDYVHVATTYSSLGQVQRELSNLDRARDYYHRAFVILHKTELRSGHVDVANFHNYLNAPTERVRRTGWPESWKRLRGLCAGISPKSRGSISVSGQLPTYPSPDAGAC